MNPLYTNGTCLPTTNRTATCTSGFLADYVIMAKTKYHVAAGVDFAREYNLRLVVRNTGHDFMGRSTAYGALAINTHWFKDIKFTQQYAGPGGYTGGAVTVGAGVQTRNAYTAAFSQNPKVNIVGGECAVSTPLVRKPQCPVISAISRLILRGGFQSLTYDDKADR